MAAALITLITALPGCSGGGGGAGEFSQEFEPPAALPPEVELPTDTGDDLSPRERRGSQN